MITEQRYSRASTMLRHLLLRIFSVENPSKSTSGSDFLRRDYNCDSTATQLRRIVHACFQFDASKKWTCQFFVVVVPQPNWTQIVTSITSVVVECVVVSSYCSCIVVESQLWYSLIACHANSIMHERYIAKAAAAFFCTIQATAENITNTTSWSLQLLTNGHSSITMYTQSGHKPGKPWILRDFSKHGKLREFSGNCGHKPGKPWILRDFSEHGKLREFSGNSVYVEWPLMKVITFTFCCDNPWKIKCMALEKPATLTEFFSPTLWPPWHGIQSPSVITTEFQEYAKINATWWSKKAKR